MVRWLARINLLSSLAFGLVASCNVDDDGFRFEPEAARGEGGDGANSAGAPYAGESGGEGGTANAGNGGAAGRASESEGGAGGEAWETNAGNGGDAGAGGQPAESGGGAAGDPGETTGGRDVGSAGNAAIDEECADGDRCAPDVPSGWSGPIALYEGPDDDLPECPDGPELFDAGVRPAQDPLGCAPCICGSVNGGACSLAMRTYNDEGCTIETSSTGVGSQCTVPITSTAFRFEGFELSGGSCNPSGGNLTERPEPRWQSVARACRLASNEGSGCDGGSACFPEPTLPFRDDICVFRAGDHACPDAYPDLRTYYTGLDDDRACSSCGCRAPTECTGTLTAYNSQACLLEAPDYRSEPVSLGAAGSCRRIEDFSIHALELTDVEYPSGCAPIAPVSTQGSVTATGPITVCCL